MTALRLVSRQCQHSLSYNTVRRFSLSTRTSQATQEIGDGAAPRIWRATPRDDRQRLTSHHVGSKKPIERRKTKTIRPVDLRHDSSVEITIEGEQHRLAPIALRDLCPCPKCIHPSSRQKEFYTQDIPSDITIKDVSYESNSVSITWNNDVPGYGEDHRTTLPLESLQRLVSKGRISEPQARLPRTYWDTQQYASDTSDFEFDSYMSSDATLYSAVRQLHTHGLLFVTNVPEDPESVIRVAERIGPLKNTFYGNTWDVRSVPEAKNVAYTASNLGFHTDLMYMKQPPHLQFLHCIRSSSAGGASLFTDAFHAAKELSETHPDLYFRLCTKTVEFHYDHPDHYYHQTRNVLEEGPIQRGGVKLLGVRDLRRAQRQFRDNEFIQSLAPIEFLESVAWSPPFQAPFKLDAEPAPDTFKMAAHDLAARLYNNKVVDWHTAAQKFNELIHRPEVIYERLMKPGECVIFDNRRVLHARKAFEVGDAGKERWLRGAYVDKDPFMSKLKVLGDKFGEGFRQGDYDSESLAEAMNTIG